MRRTGPSTLAALCLTLCGGALAGGIEGVYSVGPKGDTLIRVARGTEAGAFVGTLIQAHTAGLRQMLNRPVMDLKRVSDTKLRGRLNAYHLRLSTNQGEWLDVPKAELLPNGDLRCTVRDASGGSADVLYQRLPDEKPKEGARQPQAAEPGELAGAWREPDGAVTHYVSHKDRYVGQIDTLSPRLRARGFRAGDERVRAKRTAPGVYRGTLRVRSLSGKHERWEEVEIAVQGGRLEIAALRDGKRGATLLTAARLGSAGGDAALLPPAAHDDGELAGAWRDGHGGVNRFVRKGDSDYDGLVVRLAPNDEGFGFTVGEVAIRVRRTGRYTYEGKVLAKTRGGREQWWEPIDIAVLRNTLKYTRHMRRGGEEQGAAVRVEK